MFRYLPEQASEVAPDVDWLNYLITDISVFFTVAIVGTMLYFAIRYRRRGGVDHETPQIRGSHLLEIVWTVIPTVICVFVAYYGVHVFHKLRTPLQGAFEVQVRAQKWKWDFQYENGKQTTNEATIPVGKPVKFILQSRDVIHSFFIPAMRVKSDVLPSQYTYVTFRPVKTGDYQLFCTEYCGKDHSQMMAKIHVVPEAEFNRWLNDTSDQLAAAKMSPAERGKAFYTQKGCNACHSLDGTRLVGPSWLKLFGYQGKLATGEPYSVDENYIRESILKPNAKIVEGFPPNLMPSFEGQVNEDNIADLIAFIKTLEKVPAPQAPPPPPAGEKKDVAALSPMELGQKVYNEKLCVTCHSLDGSVKIGPSFKGIWGRQEELADGTTVTADEAYIKRSILEPAAQIVKGFSPVMPPFQGQLSDQEMNGLIEFLKAQK